MTVSSAQAKEKVLETHIMSLEAEKKKNTKLISKLKAIWVWIYVEARMCNLYTYKYIVHLNKLYYCSYV